jgi:hypothetical protein
LFSHGEFEFNLADIGIQGTVVARDLWAHSDIGEVTGAFKVSQIPAHGSIALRFKVNQQTQFLA